MGAYTFKSYSVRKSKIEKSFYRGFQLEEDGSLSVSGNAERHLLFLHYIDSGEVDLEWGRLKIDTILDKEMAVSIRAFAVNHLQVTGEVFDVNLEEYLLSEEVGVEEKEAMFEYEFMGHNDVLLYGMKGRYLWLCIEVIGSGNGMIRKINVDSPGDIMLDIFPEIYQERDSFFHRYLSVFSSVFMDFEYDIEGIHRQMDLETAPIEYLNLFGNWMGLNLSGSYLDEEKLRKLLLKLHSFNRMKGTKKVISELAELLLDEDVIIVERNLLDSEEKDLYNTLYGNSPYDFTILVNGEAEEQIHPQLMFWLEQFIPVRSRVNIVFLSECACLDSYCYLDINAAVHSAEKGVLDYYQRIDGSIILS